MSVTAAPIAFAEPTFTTELSELVLPWRAAAVPAPELLVLNEPLAQELGADLRGEAGLGLLTGASVPESVAMGYAGHQFGMYSPRLGDGRALLLGEVVDRRGRRRDLHLKGSGRTPFARGGDGKAVVGPMLREHLISEAMHALGIPTTRALAVVATGEQVARDTLQPGAILARVAASHVRVGTFEYAVRIDRELTRRLADHVIARHHPQAAEADDPYLALLEAVVEVQARLVARWMHVGFVHGVMNTDNMAISGETIDYGPCAFMDAYDPATVFSSIDHGGRYAYGNQPAVAQWNLARLAETLLGLFRVEGEAAVGAATEAVQSFTGRFEAHWLRGMRDKLGLRDEEPGDRELVVDLLDLLQEHELDHTNAFRMLSGVLRGAPARLALAAWIERWRERAPDAEAMDRVNPRYIPRNHLVEEALAAATAGDLAPYHRLLEVLTRPFDDRPGLERYAEPAPPQDAAYYQTFCGT